MSAVRAIGDRRTNAQLVVDLVALGHLQPDWLVYDCTYGLGRWWTNWVPPLFVASDLHTAGDTELADGRPFCVDRVNFTAIPLGNRSIDVVVFDGPYKLNGTPSAGGPATSDADYGVAEYASWRDRLELLVRGTMETARVADKRLVVKCQDQVVSGQKRWQTRILADAAESSGYWRLADMLYVQGYRAQPARTRKCETCDGIGDQLPSSGDWRECPAGCVEGRVPSPQQHAAADYSTCLVFVPR